MRVWVDRSRYHVEPCRVDPSIRICLDGLTESRDGLTLDQDVPDKILGAVDDPSALDQ